MSRIKKASFGVLGVITLLVALSIIINIGDEELSAEARARLSMRKPVPPEVLEGYKYELGLFAAADANVREAGSKFYEKALVRKPDESLRPPQDLQVNGRLKWCVKTGGYCAADQRKLHGADIETLLKENAPLLARYDRLMEYPGAAGDLKSSVMVRTNVFPLKQLADLKRVDWSEKIARREDEAFLREWKRSNEFYQAKLKYPDTMLAVTLSTATLRANRSFMETAMKDTPRLKPGTEVLNSAVLKIPVEQIDSNVILGELEGTVDITQMKVRDGFFGIGSKPPPKVDLMKLTEHWFRRTQTINEAEKRLAAAMTNKCVKVNPAVPCERQTWFAFSKTLVNPVGNFVVDVMTGFVAPRLRDLHKMCDQLEKPFQPGI